jgi:hypothetical protein
MPRFPIVLTVVVAAGLAGARDARACDAFAPCFDDDYDPLGGADFAPGPRAVLAGAVAAMDVGFVVHDLVVAETSRGAAIAEVVVMAPQVGLGLAALGAAAGAAGFDEGLLAPAGLSVVAGACLVHGIVALGRERPRAGAVSLVPAGRGVALAGTF